MVQVDERTYMANEQKRLDELAELIRGCGITLYEISKGSRVKYDTLLRALRKQVIRPENEARIRLYIQIKNSSKNEDDNR